MRLALLHPTKKAHAKLTITGSKSETNRLLLLQALYPQLTIENQSNSDDSVAMHMALTYRGEAKRYSSCWYSYAFFLLLIFATKENSDIVLTGSQRMQERPIALLVDALNALGGNISYTKEEGYPPLSIIGKQLEGGEVTLPANYIQSVYLCFTINCAEISEGFNPYFGR